MNLNCKTSAFISSKEYNSFKKAGIVLISAFVLLLMANTTTNATTVNAGTVYNNTSWAGTTTSNSCSTRGSKDMQYQFTAGFSGTYTFSTCNGATWDTYLYLSSNNCNSGNIAYNDDDCGLQSTLSATLTAGNTYYLLIEGYSNSSSGSYTISVTSPCSPEGDQTTYGNGSWTGYVYSSTSAGLFSNYIGYVTENETFNRTHSGPVGATTNLSCSNPTDLFAIRYKMTKNFAAGLYNFTVGGDDGIRLSVDGGATWLINSWIDHSYATYTASVYLNGNTNLVMEFYENGGIAHSSFSYTVTPSPATPGNPTSNSPNCGSVTITRNGNPPAGETWYWQTSSTGTDMTYSGTSYTTTTSGTYYIRSRRNSDNMWGSAAGISVTVNPNVPVSVSISSDATANTICSGVPAVFSANPVNGGNTTYQWKINGDNAGNNSQVFSTTGLVQGDVVSVVITSDVACATSNPATSNSIVMNVISPEISNITDGDFVWSGNLSSDWENPGNWLVFNGSYYNPAVSTPDNTVNVFLSSYSNCVSNSAMTSAGSVVNCKDINIETGLSLGNISHIHVSGNWNNSGTFLAGNGIVEFIGNSVQTINAGTGSFNNIVFNNSSSGNLNIEIVSPLVVEGTATFENGILFCNGSGSVTFGDNSSAVINSVRSFVNGSVTKTGSGAFIFPTGDVSSRDIDGNGTIEYSVAGALGINPDVASTVTVEYNFSNTGMPDWWEHSDNMEAGLNHVSDRENWVVNSDNDINVTLYWSDNAHADGDICIHGFDAGNSGDFVPSDLTIAYWNGSTWIDAGYNSDPLLSSIEHDAGFITSRFAVNFGTKSDKIITFGSKNNLNPLPVELVEFKADCADGSVEISWTTASEINNDYFVIEKSENMTDFELVEKVYGAGNSNTVNNYSIYDNASENQIYYRLTQVDFDGKTTVYSPIAVNCKSNNTKPILNVYPNPFDSEVTVMIENYYESQAVLQIIDQTGNIVFEENIEPESGINTVYINTSDLKPSVYHLRIVSSNNILNQKLVKK